MKNRQTMGWKLGYFAAMLALSAAAGGAIEFQEAKARIDKAKTADHKAITVLMCANAGLRAKEFSELAAGVCAEALKSEDAMARYYAARALAELGEPALPIAMEAMTDKDSNVRREALRAIGALAGAEGVQILAEAACGVTDAGERQAARGALAALQGANVESTLLAFVANADELNEARKEVALALAQRRASAALPTLLKLAREDADEELRAACLAAAGELGGLETAPALLEAVKAGKTDKDRLAAADALAALLKRNGAPAAESEKITADLGKAPEQSKPALACALASVGGEAAAKKVEDFLLSEKSASNETKLAIYERLAKSGAPGAAALLLRTWEDIKAGILDAALGPKVEEAAFEAAESISKTHPEQAISVFKKLAEQADKKNVKRAEDAMSMAWLAAF